MLSIAIMDSGNYALALCRALERKGYVFEVVSTPCQLAKSGCGYCIKYPSEFTELVVREGKDIGIPVREVFNIIPYGFKNRYEKVWIG